MLMASFTIPTCLQDADQLKKEHEHFQIAVEVSDSAGPQPSLLISAFRRYLILVSLAEDAHLRRPSEAARGDVDQREPLRPAEHPGHRRGCHPAVAAACHLRRGATQARHGQHQFLQDCRTGEPT